MAVRVPAGWVAVPISLAVLVGLGSAVGAPVHPASDAATEPASTSPTPSPAQRGERGEAVQEAAQDTVPSEPKLSASRPKKQSALALLASIPVKGRAPNTGYERDEFGQAWLDTDRNGCDTRNDILGRDLTDPVAKPGTRSCVVEAGTLSDPYTGRVIAFSKGSNTVDIDHVVSLSNSWQTGAFRWEIRKRAAFANDPMNLLAVDMSANRQKGDGDTATWLPPHKWFRCAYAARQVSVKAKYGLWVTRPERNAMQRILTTCPAQPALTGGAPVIAPVKVNRPATPRPKKAAPFVSGPGEHVHYENCDAVRAADADPVRAGDPGYSRQLDRDGDGVGCE